MSASFPSTGGGTGAVDSVNGATGVVVLGATDVGADVSGAAAAVAAASQPVDSDLTAIAALSTTAYGRAFLALADAAAGRTALGLGSASTSESAAFEPSGSVSTETARATTAEGLAAQKSANLSDLASASTARTNLGLGSAATQASSAFEVAGAAAAAQAASQPADSDLSAIAALTTTAYGRAFLALADAAAGRTALGLGTAATSASTAFDAAGAAASAQAASQPLDSDLTALAGIAPVNDDLVQRKAGAWTNRTPAQVKTDLALAKGDVGLGNVDNTADTAKPVSTAQQTAIDLAVPKALVDAKGDLLVGTADNTVAKKAAGADGRRLASDSTQVDGLTWALPAEARLPSGLYRQLIVSQNTATTPTKNREYCIGLLLAPQTIDRIGFRVTNTSDVGAVVRIGIRADSSGQPGAPALDSAVPADGGAAWKVLSTTYAHPGGVLWLTWTSQNWTTTGPGVDSSLTTSLAPGSVPMVSAAIRSTPDWNAGHTVSAGYQDGVTGALGSTFTNASISSQSLIVVAMRGA